MASLYSTWPYDTQYPHLQVYCRNIILIRDIGEELLWCVFFVSCEQVLVLLGGTVFRATNTVVISFRLLSSQLQVLIISYYAVPVLTFDKMILFCELPTSNSGHLNSHGTSTGSIWVSQINLLQNVLEHIISHNKFQGSPWSSTAPLRLSHIFFVLTVQVLEAISRGMNAPTVSQSSQHYSIITCKVPSHSLFSMTYLCSFQSMGLAVILFFSPSSHIWQIQYM